MASLILLLAALVINLMPTKRPEKKKKKNESPADGIASHASEKRVQESYGSPDASYKTWFYVTALAFVMAVRGILFTFAFPYAKATGVPVIIVAYVLSFFGASRFLTYVFTLRDEVRGWLLAPDRIRVNIIICITLASLGGVLPLIPDRTGATFLISFIIVGVAASMVTAISQTEMMRLDPTKRGEKAGLQESSIGMGVALGPIVAGLASGGSLVAPFFLPLGGILVVIPALLLGTRRGVRQRRMHTPGRE
jgi:predicted MFS family arabinose efflux permease